MKKRHSTEQQLRGAGVRLTRKKVELADLLISGGPRHVTAEQLWQEAQQAGIDVSLATVYNTLNELHAAGLVQTPNLGLESTVFDTNTTSHHHMVDASTGVIVDLPADAIHLNVGVLPADLEVEGLEVLVKVRARA